MNGENMIINNREIHPTLLKTVIVCSLIAGALAGYAFWKQAGTGAVGVDVVATRGALNQAAEKLSAADHNRDSAVAEAMLDTTNAILLGIQAGARQSPAMRNCQLAAAHLADGVLSVYKGGAWEAKGRYESAVSGCA